MRHGTVIQGVHSTKNLTEEHTRKRGNFTHVYPKKKNMEGEKEEDIPVQDTGIHPFRIKSDQPSPPFNPFDSKANKKAESTLVKRQKKTFPPNYLDPVPPVPTEYPKDGTPLKYGTSILRANLSKPIFSSASPLNASSLLNPDSQSDIRHVMFTTSQSGSYDLSNTNEYLQHVAFNAASSLSPQVKVLHFNKEVETNRFGLPTIPAMFIRAQEQYPDALTYTFFNSDIMFNSSWLETVEDVVEKFGSHQRILLIGMRRNTIVPESRQFSFDSLYLNSILYRTDAEDYFTCTKNAFDWTTMPKVVPGRAGYDNFLVHKAKKDPHQILIDGSLAVIALHLVPFTTKAITDDSMMWERHKFKGGMQDRDYNFYLLRKLGQAHFLYGQTFHADLQLRHSTKYLDLNQTTSSV